jgi:hypothetical protein
VNTVTITEDNNTLRQIRFGIRIGQAISAGTGISLDYLRRFNIDQQEYFGESQYITLFKEEDIFDDPYSYSGYDIGLTITRLMPWQVKSSLGFEYQNKNYSMPALDLNGESLEPDMERLDKRSQVWLTLRKAFPLNRTTQSFGLQIRLLYMINRSNDLYFDYKNLLISTGMDFNF